MHKHTHISGRASNCTSRSASITHTPVAVYWRFGWWWQTPISTLDCLHKHIFLLHTYTSVSHVCIRRYTQLTYLFHQCVMSLLSSDGHIADCTLGHPGVERPLSSWNSFLPLMLKSQCLLFRSSNLIFIICLCMLIPQSHIGLRQKETHNRRSALFKIFKMDTIKAFCIVLWDFYFIDTVFNREETSHRTGNYQKQF